MSSDPIAAALAAKQRKPDAVLEPIEDARARELHYLSCAPSRARRLSV
jgi:hypothetical protein